MALSLAKIGEKKSLVYGIFSCKSLLVKKYLTTMVSITYNDSFSMSKSTAFGGHYMKDISLGPGKPQVIRGLGGGAKLGNKNH